MTAVMGFLQSMLVASLYHMRSTLVIDIVSLHEAWIPKFFKFLGFNLLLAFGASLSLFLISPAAAGSGIPDVKAYLNGVESPVFRNFFTIKTFVAKVIGSALAVGSSLVMGKEGPMLHAGSILAVILGSSNWFKQKMDAASHWGTYTYNRDIRDLVACGAACGVCTAFKAPVGGVLFAMEMSTRWRKELTWRCFLVSAITIVVVKYSISICVSHGHCSYLQWGSLAWFQQAYPTPYGQTWAFVLLAVVGGWVASVFTSFNTWVCLVRKKWSKFFSFRILEVCVISIITSIVLFAVPLGGRCKTCDTQDPEHCVKGASMFMTFGGYGCSDGTYNDLAVLAFNPQGFKIQALFSAPHGTFHVTSLLLYSAIYYFLAAITYGAFIPSGLFTVSLIFGGCFGRIWAEVLLKLGLIDGSAAGIVGIYALLGAASFLGGLMRMSASMCLVLMEMTGAPNTLPFLMMVLIISKGVGDRFNYSVFDHQIMLKGFNFIGGIPEHIVNRAHLEAEDVMSKPKVSASFAVVESSENLVNTLDAHKTSGAFPVISVPARPGEVGDFMGIISRPSVMELLAQHEDEPEIDLSSKVEVAPIVIPPGMPLTFIYNLMQEQGVNYVPVIRCHGPLEGMVTRGDIVEVQNHKLDRFHVKEQLAQAASDIQGGRIIQSMMIEKQAAALREAITGPLVRARELAMKDIREHDELLDGSQ
uniref:Chloride channel protein n=1 Tax=Tetradesmus obliquus TaxID=3088 RepID=A0A383VTF4_TETOB|eukprot:jgi/Sobl393_1/2440/SZX68062.1